MICFLISQIDNPSDLEFLTDLFHEYNRLMYHTAQKYVPNQYDKEEIVQDSFVKIIENVHRIRKIERYALPFYLVIIVRHTAINYLRRTSTRNQHLFFVEDHDLIQTYSEERVSLGEAAAILEHREAVDYLWSKLDDLDQYVLGGYYFVGLSSEEIAKALGCSTDAVRMKLSRARKRARKLLTEEGLVYE